MKKLILLLGTGWITLGSFAQTKDSISFSFSLQQAIDFALQNQKDVKNAMIDEQIAQKKVNEITGLGLPQINGSFDLREFIEIPTSLIPAEIFGGPPGSFAAVKFGTKYNATAGLDASQLLFSGDYFLGLKASKVYVEISSKSTQRTKIETSATVAKAYFTVLVNEERTKLIDATVERVKQTLSNTKSLLDNGFVEKIDFDRLTVTYNNLLVEQEKYQRLLKLGTYLLKYQMGMDINANLTLTDKLEDVKLDVSNTASAQKFDYEKRVEYGLFQTQFKLAKLELKRQRLSYLPTAFAYGSLSGAAQRNEFDIFDTDKKWFPTSVVGAKVTMPIFTGLQRHARNQQAKLSLLKAENNIDFIKKSIDLEVASASTILQNASSSLENQKKNITIAEDVVRVSKLKYEQGVGSNIELITAETSLKEAQTNYFNALFDALVAKIDFDKANGNLK
ncbi:MAG: TolC family protein [Bacteroidetes bacterium]|nr:TolC family protein [Bacteroidota bacterium]